MKSHNKNFRYPSAHTVENIALPKINNSAIPFYKQNGNHFIYKRELMDHVT